VRKKRQPDEHRHPKPRHHHHGAGGVLCRRFLEHRHAVGDGLHSGQRGAAVGESGEQEKRRDQPGVVGRQHIGRGDGFDTAGHGANRAGEDQAEHDREKGVDRHAEQARRFLEPPQVAEGEQREERQAQPRLADVQRRERRRDRGDAGGDADGHRQRVIDQERCGGGQARHRTEVVARNDVSAASARKREDRLAKRERDGDQQDRDQDRDRLRERHGGQAADHQDAEHFLGGVGDRGERVRGQDRETAEDPELVMAGLVRRDWAADDHPFERSEHVAILHMLPRLAVGLRGGGLCRVRDSPRDLGPPVRAVGAD
jgi:hypothetical protein